MSDRATVFQRSTDSQRGVTSGFGLPRDLLDKSRRRIETVAWLILLAGGLDGVMLIGNLITWRRTDAASHPTLAWIICSPLGVLLSIAMIVAARSPRIKDTALLSYALVFEVAHCLLISISSPVSFYQDNRALPVLTWVTPLIIFFPLIIPCPPRRTLITATIAAVTAPLGLFLGRVTGQIAPSTEAYFAIAFSPALAVAIAYFGSRVVYGLGLEVAAARRLGAYRLERLLGRGGMGEVWLARHAMLARPAAVKLVRPELLGTDASPNGSRILERFEREAQATASMRSPHTIQLYDYGVASDGTFYYVMEFLEGFTAETLVTQFGPLPAERVIHLLRQVCHSLAEAHEAGLIHRDIKPANVYVCRYGRDPDFVKVLDFGLVKTTSGAESAELALTAENVICGTPAYMAPEQSVGQDSGDARSDLYSVGCVAHWLLTGEPVFQGATAMEVLVHHARTAPTPPSQRTEMPVPQALDDLVLSLLDKDPARRPASASVLARRLDELASTHPWSEERALAWWDAHRPEGSVEIA